MIEITGSVEGLAGGGAVLPALAYHFNFFLKLLQ